MALKATVFRVQLAVADLGRHHYGTHELTLARHPSETDERMMYRLVAFALHAHDDLEFTRGLSNDDEPDLWQKDLTGAVLLWMELGQPDLKRARRACGLARRVMVYTYDHRAARQWWSQHGTDYARFANLGVCHLAPRGGGRLDGLVQRSMELSATIQDDQIWLADGNHAVELERAVWQVPT